MPIINYPQHWYIDAHPAMQGQGAPQPGNALNQLEAVFHGGPVNAPAPEQDPAQEQDPGQDYVNALFQHEKMKQMYGKTKAKATLPSSPTSEEYLDLIAQTTALEGLIRRESEELEHVLEKISTQVEVVRDIGSTIRTHISSLQKAAIQLEKWRLTMPQPSSPGSETGLAGGRSVPAGAGPFAQVGQVEVAPGLLLQDQG